MKLYSFEEAARIDRELFSRCGFPRNALVERAGYLFANRVREIMATRFAGTNPEDLRIIAVAGKGNNGKDVLIAARELAVSNVQVSVLLSHSREGHPLSEDINCLSLLGVPVRESPDFAKTDIILDGLLGTGSTRPADSFSSLISLMNESSAVRISVDVPSGAYDSFEPGDPIVHADHTVSLGFRKKALYSPDVRRCAGNLTRVPLPYPQSVLDTVSHSAVLRSRKYCDLPAFSTDAYKNQRGHLAVFAGSVGTHGAAILSASAALSAGAGLVTLFVPRDIHDITASAIGGSGLTSLMVHPLDSGIVPDISRFSAILAGPGWSGSVSERALLAQIWLSPQPLILDAGALSLIDDFPDRGGLTVITPHPGELRRMMKPPVRFERWYQNTLSRFPSLHAVLKSHVTWIFSPDSLPSAVDGMNPFMGTAGSGDVLAGTIAGILARKSISAGDIHSMICSAVAAHQRAGYILARRNGFFHSDALIPRIGRILAKGASNG